MPSLSTALAHLPALRETFRPGEADEASGLTREDMDVIIDTLDAVGADVVARDPE